MKLVFKRILLAIFMGFLAYGGGVLYNFLGGFGEDYYPTHVWMKVIAYPAIMGAELFWRFFQTPFEVTYAVGLLIFFFQFFILGYLLALAIFRQDVPKSDQEQPLIPSSPNTV